LAQDRRRQSVGLSLNDLRRQGEKREQDRDWPRNDSGCERHRMLSFEWFYVRCDKPWGPGGEGAY
jgi:hypothetical protein